MKKYICFLLAVTLMMQVPAISHKKNVGAAQAGSIQNESTENSTDEAEKADAETMDVLFIGNSMTYYNTLSNVVQGIAERKGKKIHCTAATNGGKNLIFQSGAQNILSAIEKGGYEIVILQDIVGGFNAENLQRGAEALVPKILQYNPQAHIVFYEPWPTKNTLTGENSLLPYFTDSYIKTAKSFNARLAPAGETFYELYTGHQLDFYCMDKKHPKPLGTFTSASTIYYTLYPEEMYEDFTADDQGYLNQLINSNIAYTNEGIQDTYSLDTLNLIFSLGYQFAHAVDPAVSGAATYISVAGPYQEPATEKIAKKPTSLSVFRQSGKPKISKATKKKSAKQVKITLKRKIKQADGYQIRFYQTRNNAKKNKKVWVKAGYQKNRKILTVKHQKIKRKRALFVRVRAYMMIKDHQYFSKWSPVKKVKIKK